mgnify:CR=1 FL=1
MQALGNTVEAYGKVMCEIADKRKEVVFVTADVIKAYSVQPFMEKHPDRVFNFGVAEQVTVGVAAGLAISGKIPIVHIYTPFLSMRSLEQVRSDVCYPNLNVKFIGIVSGIIMGIGGSTHQSVEDMAIFRAIPNMVVMVPCDAMETTKATEACMKHAGPTFIRLGRYPVPNVYKEDYQFTIGKSVLLRDGGDVSIIASGHMIKPALDAAEALAQKGVSARVINMHTLKPLDRDAIVKAARETRAIVTAEEHNVLAGLGGAVAEVVVQECPVPMRLVGIEDAFCGVGPTDELFEKFGLTARNIRDCAEELVAAKG